MVGARPDAYDRSVRFPILAAVAGLALLAGCRDDDRGIPAACRQGADTVRLALLQAPGEVRLEGTTPISDCIDDTSSGGDMSDVGVAYVAVAQRLADEAERRPNSPEALRLGYLVGAVERSRRGSQGVGYELGRRLQQEARRVPASSQEYRTGLRAGRDSG
jgi:hypothetical protein